MRIIIVRGGQMFEAFEVTIDIPKNIIQAFFKNIYKNYLEHTRNESLSPRTGKKLATYKH